MECLNIFVSTFINRLGKIDVLMFFFDFSTFFITVNTITFILGTVYKVILISLLNRNIGHFKF